MIRPDISFYVNHLSQFLQTPTNTHMQFAKRLLRYVKGSSNLGLGFTLLDRPVNNLTSYCDSNWGNDLDDRRSISGNNIWFAGNLVAWAAKKQRVVSKSSCEVEYRALFGIISEIKWFCYLFRELGD